MQCKLIFLFLVLSMLCGCRGEETAERPAPLPENVPTLTRGKGCPACHPEVRPETPHEFSCSECHQGDAETDQKEIAHQGLIARPAHPEHMQAVCGRCHAGQVQSCADSLHFTLRNEINLVRAHFGATETLPNLTAIPTTPSAATPLALADDLLRRRCLRCHVYAAGDNYPLTRHGTGCAACHMAFSEGKPQDHRLQARPTDEQCLACHYGNVVGADYYGRSEQDYNWEYRTPFVTREPYLRPYGVEYHDLATDIHQRRGLACIDCHWGDELMGGGKLTCSSCHRTRPDAGDPLPANVTRENGNLSLTSRTDGRQHPIPQPSHPAHAQYGKQVACPVCHAQWAFNDSTTHLLRSESDDFLAWERLAVQGSSEVEYLVNENLSVDGRELPPTMRDGITGEERPGTWYQGFTQRRWEEMLVRRDRDGMIKVFRPVLDLRLSAVDEDGNVLADNIAGNGTGLLPYTPHTIGPAGLFYRNRFAALLEPEPANRP